MPPRFDRADFERGGAIGGEEGGFVDESFGALGDELEVFGRVGEGWREEMNVFCHVEG